MTLFGKYDVIGAPLAGLTDSYFRKICKNCGADLTYTEMVSAQGLNYKSRKTFDLLNVSDSESEVSVQLFGHDRSVLSEMAKVVEDLLGERLAYIDINMGCPARKIVSKGDGAALMKTPFLAGLIVESVKSSVNCKVTAKFRRGYYESSETCVEFAKTLESAGVDAVCVHGRFAEQMYRGKSDLSAIARVKDAVNVPVIGNGDITCGQDAVFMKKTTNCDAIMIARKSLANPFIFEECKAALKGEVYAPKTLCEIIDVAIKQVSSYPDDYPFARFRKHAMYYVKGMKGSTVARELITHASSCSEFVDIFEKLKEVNDGL